MLMKSFRYFSIPTGKRKMSPQDEFNCGRSTDRSRKEFIFREAHRGTVEFEIAVAAAHFSAKRESCLIFFKTFDNRTAA